ncbi:MAG: toxin-antitoxin system HicB family antitoxin [Caulobacteraceae bacterium]
MSKGAYPLKLPHSIKAAAARLAMEDGVSLNQWIASAVAQKVGVMETAAEFFKRRATGRTGEGLGRLLDKTPDRPADAGDALPEGWDRETSGNG